MLFSYGILAVGLQCLVQTANAQNFEKRDKYQVKPNYST
jgi:hypothetical protein